VLSDIQVEAIYKYIEDSYLSSYSTTKAIVYTVVGCLRTNQIPSKNPPTWCWFQTFIKAYPELFKALKSKAIARVYISTADIEEIKDWFQGFCI
jgi:hypothetical protein